MTQPTRRIGFRTSYDEELEVESMKQINTVEDEDSEQQDSPYVALEDYIPGAVYDGQGNIVTQKSFNAKVKKTRAEARNQKLTAISRLIFYTALAISIIGLSYGVYQKYLKEKPRIECQKTK